MKLIVCSGLPASGKTTWAREQCQLNHNLVRVNKDDIRKDLTAKGWVWSHKNERDVIRIRDERIFEALSYGKDVVSDDTNFGKHRDRLKEIADSFGATFEVRFFPIAIEEAIRRDAAREASVGADVIRRMAEQYLPPVIVPYVPSDDLPWCILCDLDGTAALITNRSPYDGGNCHLDQPNVPVRTVLRLFDPSHLIIYMSGRDDTHRDKTLAWLETHYFPKGPLHMRRAGDRRKDAIVKSELFDQYVRGQWNVFFVLDDRNQVVQMWRSLGLTVFQVADGDF